MMKNVTHLQGYMQRWICSSNYQLLSAAKGTAKPLLSSLKIGYPLYQSRQFSTHPFSSYPSLKILFGSQTGNAQLFSEDLAEAASTHESNKFDAQVIDLQDVQDPASLFHSNAEKDDEILVFVTACYGQGEPTDNAKDFYEWLMSDDSENQVQENVRKNIKYAVFGLGNSQSFAERYQAVGKNIEKRMNSLKARPVFLRGEGDDSGHIETDFETWKNNFLSSLASNTNTSSSDIEIPIPENASSGDSANSTNERTSTPASTKKFSIQLIENTEILPRNHIKIIDLNDTFTAKNPLYSPLVDSRSLCPNSVRMKKDLLFSIQHDDNIGLEYETGDHVGVWPKNSETQVKRLATRLNIPLNECITISSDSSEISPPFVSTEKSPVTLATIFKEFYDLNGPVTPTLLRVISQYATDDSDRQTLNNICNLNCGQYIEAIKKPMFNIVDVLYQFPSINISWQDLMISLQRIQPRYYSISSSPNLNPGKLRITVGEMKFNIPNRTAPFTGLCSTYLCNMQKGDEAAMFVRKSNFRLPQQKEMPIICVAGGTGIAPFHGFYEERLADLNSRKNSKFGDSLLFFGARNIDELMYIDELETAKKLGIFSKVIYSLSDTEGKFVSDSILEHKKEVWELLKLGAPIYICGGVHGFGESIYNAIKQIAKERNLNGDDFILQLREEGRCFEDLSD